MEPDFEAVNAAQWENDTEPATSPKATPEVEQSLTIIDQSDLIDISSQEPDVSPVSPAPTIVGQAAISNSVGNETVAESSVKSRVNGPKTTDSSNFAVNPGPPSGSRPSATNRPALAARSNVTNQSAPAARPRASLMQQRRGVVNGPLARRQPTDLNRGVVARKTHQGLTRGMYWSKNEGPVTKRVKKFEDQNKETRLLSKQFLKEPGKDQSFEAIAAYKVDAFDLTLLGENLEELNDIRKVFGVYMDYDKALETLRIRSPTKQDTTEVFRAVRLLFKELDAINSSSAPLYLIHPPVASKYRSLVKGSSKDENALGNPIIDQLTMTGVRLTNTHEYTNLVRPQRMEANRNRYFKHLQQKLQDLRALKTYMSMRVNFGTLKLERYPEKLLNNGMSIDDFSTMMSSNKSKSSFDNKIGGFDVATKILNRVAKADGLFRPVGQTQYTFIVFAKNESTNETARVEIKLQREKREMSSKLQHQHDYTIGTITTFGFAKSKTRIDVSTMFIDEKYDMCHQLSIDTDTTKDLSDSAMQELVQKIRNAKMPMTEDNTKSKYCRLHFLNDSFRAAGGHEFIGHLKVESVLLRSSKVFAILDSGFKDSKYRMVVDRDRKWKGHNTKGDPEARDCGVSVHHQDWFGELEELEHVGDVHSWSAGLGEFFTGPDGFEGFYTMLNDINRVLTEADASKS